jgi:hypothetical protein
MPILDITKKNGQGLSVTTISFFDMVTFCMKLGNMLYRMNFNSDTYKKSEMLYFCSYEWYIKKLLSFVEQFSPLINLADERMSIISLNRGERLMTLLKF